MKEQKLVKQSEYETAIIENAIIKIGTLLALGFGEAGSEIIGSNMKNVGDVDPMIPGKKKCCIFGFCDIRNFTDATEQLQVSRPFSRSLSSPPPVACRHHCHQLLKVRCESCDRHELDTVWVVVGGEYTLCGGGSLVSLASSEELSARRLLR